MDSADYHIMKHPHKRKKNPGNSGKKKAIIKADWNILYYIFQLI